MTQCVQPLIRPAGFDDVLGGQSSEARFDDVLGGQSSPRCQLTSHHAFVVSYALGKDLELGFHVDASDITLNVCLGTQFTGGELFFKGVRCNHHRQGRPTVKEDITYSHTPGVALLHRGKHRHGAHRLTSGERHNLILWCRGDPTCSSEGCTGMGCQPWCWGPQAEEELARAAMDRQLERGADCGQRKRGRGGSAAGSSTTA